MTWKPIETMPRNSEGECASRHNVVVGWWFNLSRQTCWWEISDDPQTECATHWIALPEPPAQAIEARRAGTPKSDSVEDESAAPKGCVQ